MWDENCSLIISSFDSWLVFILTLNICRYSYIYYIHCMHKFVSIRIFIKFIQQIYQYCAKKKGRNEIIFFRNTFHFFFFSLEIIIFNENNQPSVKIYIYRRLRIIAVVILNDKGPFHIIMHRVFKLILCEWGDVYLSVYYIFRILLLFAYCS